MIDPVTALEGLQSAIAVVKKAAKIANDLGGLAGVVGKLFDARSQATKAMLEAKRSGNKSNFSVAMQIENLLMEERMMLFARGTAAGYSGAIAAPTGLTASSPAASGSQTALAANTYYIYITADAGISQNGFGESIVSAVASETVASGDVLSVSFTGSTGALGYNVYVGTATGTANCKYVGTVKGGTTVVIQGAGATNLPANNFAFSTSGAAASRANADTSAYATGYDGILPTVLGPNSGFNNAINSAFSTANPGVEFQNVFAGLYESVKADPDVVLLNGNDRKQLSDAIKSGSTANYRLVINDPGQGGTTYAYARFPPAGFLPVVYTDGTLQTLLSPVEISLDHLTQVETCISLFGS